MRRLLLAALLPLLAAAPATASPRYDVDGPRAVKVGERVEVSLAPTLNRGGTCCGIMVRGAQADEDGDAVLRFRWPARYWFGSEKVRWTPGAKADVIVFGDEGRGIAVVRVKRH